MNCWLIISIINYDASDTYNYSPLGSEGDMQWSSWPRHSAADRKVAASVARKVIGFSSWPTASGRTMDLEVDSASNRSEYKNILVEIKAWPARNADNISAIW
jgi:hypothetical protein